MSDRILVHLPHRRKLDTGDRLFIAVVVAANVVPWGLFIWGLTQ